jgi:hypothetical protein
MTEGGSLPLRNDVQLKSTNDFALAAQCARAMHKFFAQEEGAGNAGCPLHPQPPVQCRKHRGRSHRYPGTPGIPCAMVLTAYVVLPGDRALLPPSSRGSRFCHCPVGPIKPPQDLTPASGRQDHTILPSATTSLVCVLLTAHELLKNPPCDPVARSTLPRPPHPAPTSVTIMIRPSLGPGWQE